MIDTVTLSNAKSIAVKGAIHNVYVTPDGKHVVSGSIPGRMITVIDQATEEIAWEGRPPEWATFSPDGKFIYSATAGDNAVSVVDTATLKEVARIPVGQVPKRNGTALLRR